MSIKYCGGWRRHWKQWCHVFSQFQRIVYSNVFIFIFLDMLSYFGYNIWSFLISFYWTLLCASTHFVSWDWIELLKTKASQQKFKGKLKYFRSKIVCLVGYEIWRCICFFFSFLITFIWHWSKEILRQQFLKVRSYRSNFFLIKTFADFIRSIVKKQERNDVWYFNINKWNI